MKHIMLLLSIVSFVILCLITSCSRDCDCCMDEYTTLAKNKITRGSGEGDIPIYSVVDSVVYQYDVTLSRKELQYTHSFNATIYVMFTHSKGKPRLELKEYIAPIMYSVNSVELIPHWDSNEIYELHAFGRDYYNQECSGMLSMLFRL